jgi:hypothetical protein
LYNPVLDGSAVFRIAGFVLYLVHPPAVASLALIRELACGTEALEADISSYRESKL